MNGRIDGWIDVQLEDSKSPKVLRKLPDTLPNEGPQKHVLGEGQTPLSSSELVFVPKAAPPQPH